MTWGKLKWLIGAEKKYEGCGRSLVSSGSLVSPFEMGLLVDCQSEKI